MSHIFIAYSRANRDLALQLKQALEDSGRSVWIDLEDLPPSSMWRLEIKEAIEACVAFIYLLSPDSIASRYCRNEFDYARELNKKIIPILLLGMSDQDIPDHISEIQWLSWDEFGEGLSEIEKLLKIIDHDYEWAKFYAELTSKAKKWERNKDVSRLLRGKELREAEERLKKTDSLNNPQSTELQRQFISESRKADIRQRRRITAGLIIIVVLFILAAISGMILFDRTPATVNVEGRIVEIRNRFNYRFFREDVGSTITAHSFPTELATGTGYTLIVGTGPDGESPGTVLAYNMRGRLKWAYDANFDPYYGPTANFSIKRIIIDNIMNNGERQIIFTTQKTDWFPSELAMLDSNGKLISSYWNSGFIYDVLLQDFDRDGIKEIVVSAVNNNLGYIVVNDDTKHPAVVYVLSPKDDFTGQIFPDLIRDRPSGTEYSRWIAVLEPFVVTGIKVRIVQEAGENLIEVQFNPQAGYVYLDAYGRIRRVGLSDYWRSQYGNKSPADYICFLKAETDGWYFPERVDQKQICPWYTGE